MADFLESDAERSEPATAKRREEIRHKGKIFKSVELNSAAALVAGLVLLNVAAGPLARHLQELTRAMLISISHFNLTAAEVHNLAMQSIGTFLIATLPIVGGIMVVGVAVNIAQVGFLFTTEPLKPKWGMLNPLRGVMNMFGSGRSGVELLKNTAKTIIVGVFGYFTLMSLRGEAFSLVDSDPVAIVGSMASMGMSVALKVSLAYLALAGLDYAYQRFDYEKKIRMTKEEVKEENRMMEGDPQVKSRIRRAQRQIAYRRMMQDVPKSDVVIANPTHVAVALKYDAKKMAAPTVMAKGADLLAQRIKEIAREHGVPIVEDVMLARTLFKSAEIGESIPEKLFQAVAQVLAYIYRLRDSKQRGIPS